MTIPLLSLWAIANAETLMGQKFSQLVYIFEFLIETHTSNPYVGKLSEFSFERDFPRVTKEGYLEQIVRDNALPSITWKEAAVSTNTRQEIELSPCITWEEEHHSQKKAPVIEQAVTALPQMADLEALRDSEALLRSADRILLDLKLGKQAPGYKAAQKALNRFIAELANPA